MVKKKSNKFGYTRQYHISLSYEQIELYHKTIQVQNALYQFALKYLYKTYGYKHVGRPLPHGRSVSFLNNQIKAMFIQEKYGLKRWNSKQLGLSSHAADEFLKTVFTNFSQYRKRLEKASKMTPVEKYNFRMNITKDKLSAKRAQLLTETYRKLAHELVDDYDTIIIEKIDAFEMRKRSYSISKVQNERKNKRLALIKPYELSQIVESLVNRQNKTLIKVDPYKTSQVEYGTEYESKHELHETNQDGKRIYISSYTGKEIDRDYNAALNIKEWGLHPEKHVKLRDYPKLKASNLVEII